MQSWTVVHIKMRDRGLVILKALGKDMRYGGRLTNFSKSVI
jgi:hypothetical protein